MLFTILMTVLSLFQPILAQHNNLVAGINPQNSGAGWGYRQASFPNLGEYLDAHLQYPEPAQKSGVEGVVTVETLIGKNGEVQSVGVVKGIGFGCDESVMELVSNMPPWVPALENGEEVAQKVFIRIRFRLK